METIRLFLKFGSLDILPDPNLVKGEAVIHTLQGNLHTVWAPLTLDDVTYTADAIVKGFMETPDTMSMNPSEWKYLQLVLNPPLPPVCECGSVKAKLPFHSDWCPVSRR